MDFISWLVVGALLMLTEFGVGTFYMLAIGLACIYPAYASYHGASIPVQLGAAAAGAMVHAMVVYVLRKGHSAAPVKNQSDDIGQRVEVIEWIDDGTARVMYQGKEWVADKVDFAMPDADHGIIQSVQYGRLLISTK